MTTSIDAHPPCKIRHLVVIRLSAMGDCILVQPTLLRILSALPEVEIDWFMDKSWAALFPAIDRLNIIAIDKPKTIHDYLALRKKYFHISED